MNPTRLLFRSAAVFLLLVSCMLWAEAADLAEAERLLQQGKTAEARTSFEAILQSEPANAAAHAGLAVVALRERRTPDAVKLAERAVELANDTARFHTVLGECYGLQALEASLFSKPGLAANSRRAFERAVELDPKDLGAVRGLFTFYLAAPAVLGGGDDKALKVARDFCVHDAKNSALLEASVHEKQKDWPAAEAALRRALEAEPQNNWARERLAAAIARGGDAGRAFAWVETLAAAEPESLRWKYQLGRIAEMTGQRLDDGIAALQIYLAAPHQTGTPSPAAAHFLLGELFAKKRDRSAARAAYEAALKLDPNHRRAAEALKKLK